jgi:regulator-associated protein of mTOR
MPKQCNRFEKVPRPSEPLSPLLPEWRHRERLRTTIGALVICLRIGYDPPDVVKTEPCARTEAWIDPMLLVREKALEQIGKNLVRQYENLATTGRTKYKAHLDPVLDDAKKICLSMRKVAKGERVLFHYNGHGVPRPTPSGEIWLFNRQYTQYIPLSLLELLGWISSPAIFIWDCSAAGNIVTKVVEFAARKDEEVAKAQAGKTEDHVPPSAQHPFADTIQLAACQAHQSLPMNPDLPADLFTSCLTSPIEMALTFFILRNPLKAGIDVKLAFQIPGKQNDRKSPLGELSWIFTAITDTIAWNTFPPALFQRLFRHDLVIAALFRGFLLAERIMRHYDCTPISIPALPATHNHPLWDSWDLAVDRCLAQLPPILAAEDARREAVEAGLPAPPEVAFQPSRFFSDELQAFELWLEQGIARAVAPADVATTPESPTMPPTDGTTRRHAVHPQQLPIVLQVLLSQAHRTRALVGLCKFLDLGPWAVNLGLSIGIFPYVLKLLQAPTVDLKPLLIFIWARILGVFRACQDDLIRVAAPVPAGRQVEPPFVYFVRALDPAANVLLIPNVSEHRAMCAFILAILCRDHRAGQLACLDWSVLDLCLQHLADIDPLLRQWSALCIAQLWNEFDEAKGHGIARQAHEKLSSKLSDEVPEVRAAVLYALASLIGAPAGERTRSDARSLSGARTSRTHLAASDQVDIELGVAMSTLRLVGDGSPQVRRELVVLLSAIVVDWEGHLLVAAYQAYEEDQARQTTGRPTARAAEERQRFIDQSAARVLANGGEGEDASTNPAFKAMMFSCIYKTLLDLASDPYPSVADHACVVVDYIHDRLLQSPLARAKDSILPVSEDLPPEPRLTMGPSGTSTPGGPIRRAGSFAAAVKSLSHLSFTDVTTAASAPQSSRASVRSSLDGPRSLRPSTSVDSLLHAARSADGSTDDLTLEDAMQQLLDADAKRMAADAASSSGAPSIMAMSSNSGASTPLPNSVTASLPLRSEFFDYCCRYFTEPQMKVRPG